MPSSVGKNSIATDADVALSNPVSSQVLTYNSSLGKWQNQSANEAIITVNAAGTGQTLTVPSSGKVTYVLTASANSCALSVTGAAAGVPAIITLWLKQGSSGNRSWTFPAGTMYPMHTAPTLSSTAGYIDIVTLTSPDAGTTWLLVPAATQAG